jgi:hypothetical protein
MLANAPQPCPTHIYSSHSASLLVLFTNHGARVVCATEDKRHPSAAAVNQPVPQVTAIHDSGYRKIRPLSPRRNNLRYAGREVGVGGSELPSSGVIRGENPTDSNQDEAFTWRRISQSGDTSAKSAPSMLHHRSRVFIHGNDLNASSSAGLGL